MLLLGGEQLAAPHIDLQLFVLCWMGSERNDMERSRLVPGGDIAAEKHHRPTRGFEWATANIPEVRSHAPVGRRTARCAALVAVRPCGFGGETGRDGHREPAS